MSFHIRIFKNDQMYYLSRFGLDDTNYWTTDFNDKAEASSLDDMIVIFKQCGKRGEIADEMGYPVMMHNILKDRDSSPGKVSMQTKIELNTQYGKMK